MKQAKIRLTKFLKSLREKYYHLNSTTTLTEF